MEAREPVGNCPAPRTQTDTMKKRKRKKPTAQAPRIHVSRDDRARTNAGKTADSKVRSEGRALAARSRTEMVMTASEAETAKRLAALGWGA